MHFCLTGRYTPQALSHILDNPTTNRQEAARKVIENAGGKLTSFYGTTVEGPGALVIFDVPDPGAAAAISGVVVAAEVLQNVKLTRLLTQDEIFQVRKHAVFPMKNHEQQPQGLRNANQAKTDSYCLDRRYVIAQAACDPFSDQNVKTPEPKGDHRDAA